MPDEPSEPNPDELDSHGDPDADVLAQTAVVAIPDFRHPGVVRVTETNSEGIIMVPGVDGPPVTDLETTVNLTGDSLKELADLVPPTAPSAAESVTRSHLKGLLEALIFASDHPQKASDLAKAASAGTMEVKDLLQELKREYQPRGIQLDEVAGGWLFRTSSAYAPFVRDLTKQKPVRLSRAQLETLAILAYRQPVTRPEIDDIRGVDSGPVLKLLLERDLVRILGKKDEPGRPMIYGTTTAFLEFFGLKSLKDLPTLREFTELSEDSRRVAERELGEVLDTKQPTADGGVGEAEARGDDDAPAEDDDGAGDTIAPGPYVEPGMDGPHDTTPPAALPDDVPADETPRGDGGGG
jgi:segregation and condensation protein B